MVTVGGYKTTLFYKAQLMNNENVFLCRYRNHIWPILDGYKGHFKPDRLIKSKDCPECTEIRHRRRGGAHIPDRAGQALQEIDTLTGYGENDGRGNIPEEVWDEILADREADLHWQGQELDRRAKEKNPRHMTLAEARQMWLDTK